MKQIRESFRQTGRLHHAYGLWGERQAVKAELLTFLTKDLKFPVLNNPDFWQGEFNVFKMADSRRLNQAHLNRPVKYDRKIFIILANALTRDAQNSLLKIFEEPRADSTFFLLLPAVTDLLPTLQSRLIMGKMEGEQITSREAENFLKANIGQRLEQTAKIIKDLKEEKITKAVVISFVKNIEQILNQAKKKDFARLGTVEKAISYLNDEAPSVKVILEHLVLTV